MIQVQPYIRFNGSCKEAFTFYRQVLGGELEVQIVGETPMADQWPAAVQDKVLNASLTGSGFRLIGSDMIAPDELQPGNDMALSLQCATEAELQTVFDRMAEGGTIVRPLHRFFAGTIGVVNDRFGKEWLFYCS